MPIRRLVAFALLVILAQAAPSFGWGGEGHQLVGWIAEERLTDQARSSIKELLGDANLSDGEIASWADEIRRQRRETAPWHYINIPVTANGYDPERDSNKGENILAAVERFNKVLADKNAPREQRIEALKFLIHFVGDLHQPLHCADRNKDKGGNAVLVFFPGQRRALKLHTVWDTWLLKTSKGKQSVADYGDELNKRITPEQIGEWSSGSAEQWAVESWNVCREHVYAGVPEVGAPVKLSDDYVKENGRIVDVQLQKAGIRLAVLLNRAFD